MSKTLIEQIEEYRIKQNQIITKLLKDELGEDINDYEYYWD